MNDTVYGVSPGLVLHEMYTVGCADLGAPSLTIVTCVTVGANIVRPQHDRSLCRERPRTRLTIMREHTVLPYGIDVADEFTDGGVRAEGELPIGKRSHSGVPCPTEQVYLVNAACPWCPSTTLPGRHSIARPSYPRRTRRSRPAGRSRGSAR